MGKECKEGLVIRSVVHNRNMYPYNPIPDSK